LRIGGLDPGKQKDSFAYVVIEQEGVGIRVKGAKRWLGRQYVEVERELLQIHNSKPCDYYILELNNTGQHVYEVLKNEMNLPILGVTTTKDIKDLIKKDSLTVMDKNEMVRHMMHWFQEGVIRFPFRSTPELEELKRQLSIFAEHKTEAGNMSYYADGQEHDDLVMALMLACWYIRKFIGTSNGYSAIISSSGRIIKQQPIIKTEADYD